MEKEKRKNDILINGENKYYRNKLLIKYIRKEKQKLIIEKYQSTILFV